MTPKIPLTEQRQSKTDSPEKQGQRLLTQSVVQLQFPSGATSVAGT
jgi:hypothetical protein